MSDGIFARLRKRLVPSRAPEAHGPAEPAPETVETQPAGGAPARDGALPAGEADAGAPAAEELRSPAEEPTAGERFRPAAATARPLPRYHPRTAAGTPGPEARAEPPEEPREPLRLTLTEAIALVQEGGGDAIELHFLRRELERRSREGQQPDDLWSRIEQKVSSRLRRMGRLAEGQTLTLERAL